MGDNTYIFSFYSHEVDEILGRTDWNEEIFAIYIPRKDIKTTIKLNK